MCIGCAWMPQFSNAGGSYSRASLDGQPRAAVPTSTSQIRLGADLRQNCPGLRRRIGSFGDGAAYDDMAGSGGDRFRGSGYAGLISVGAAGGAHARRNDSKIVAQFGAHDRGLAGGGDDALASVVEGQRGQAQDFLAYRSLEPDFS